MKTTPHNFIAYCVALIIAVAAIAGFAGCVWGAVGAFAGGVVGGRCAGAVCGIFSNGLFGLVVGGGVAGG